MHVLVPVLVMFVLSAALMGVLHLAYRARASAAFRIKEDPKRKVVGLRLYARVLANMVLSGVLVIAMSLGGERLLVHAGADPWWRVAWHTGAILLVYDLLYYFLHRFAFHQWSWLKKVHTVHHLVRHPTAFDSLYLHPVETALGLVLLFSCIALFGPVSLFAFFLVITAHSLVNVIVHSGLDVPLFGLRFAGYLARKHDLHHTSMRGGNFASITPFWDKLFGTAE
jgi:sterol desaturase/sphingolipid hydroxylase (fatty acid hydroxylase superfamily)